MKRSVNPANKGSHLAIALVPVLVLCVAFSGCNLPRPQSPAGTGSGEDDTDASILATLQGALSSTQGSSGKPDMNCQKDGPWFLNIDENFTIVVGDDQVIFKIGGYVQLVLDQVGNVSAGATRAFGEAKVEGGCLFYATWTHKPQISGTCQSGVMKLKIVEMLGNNGVIQGPANCDGEMRDWNFGFPQTMNHDLTVSLIKPGGGWVRIPWGIFTSPGYKSWGISNYAQDFEPEPLVSPAP